MSFIAPVEDSPVPLIGLAYIMSLPLNQAVILVRVADEWVQNTLVIPGAEIGSALSNHTDQKEGWLHREKRNRQNHRCPLCFFKVVYYFLRKSNLILPFYPPSR